MVIQSAAVIARNEDIMFNDLNDSMVMMSIDNGEYYNMDPVGAHIWKLLEKPLSIREICDKLLEEYEISAASCEEDVLAFVEEMQEFGVVKVIH